MLWSRTRRLGPRRHRRGGGRNSYRGSGTREYPASGSGADCSDFYDKSPAERKLVFKLDCFMLASMTIGWWVKNLDQSNVSQHMIHTDQQLSNAYVSGMKEDLNIYGNEYTYMLSIYAAVVAVMQVPSNFIAMKVRPRYLLAGSEMAWGIFTFAQAGAGSVGAM
jgi:ACS family pantothenate transporter-like MFS transporter